MGTIGQELKSAREAKGLSLRDLADKTRITYTYLEALEAENYSEIPGEVFVTGFLRTYAREVGLDENALLSRYRQSRGPSEAQAPAAKTATAEKGPSIVTINIGHGLPEEKKRNIKLIAILTAVLLFAVISVYLAHRKQSPVQAAHPSKPVPAAIPAPFRPATTSASKPSVQKDMTTGARVSLKLRLTALDTSWYSYKADDSDRKRGTLKEGDVIEISADKKILLDLGNAGGTKVEFNGKALGRFGPSGTPRKNIFFSEGKPGVVLPPVMNGHSGLQQAGAAPSGKHR